MRYWLVFGMMFVIHIICGFTVRPSMTLVDLYDVTVASGGALLLHSQLAAPGGQR